MLIFVFPSFIIPVIFWDTKINKIISLASCISIGEFLRGNIFTGFSWNNFSHSLAVNENLMQIFSITGQYLATFFLIVISQFLLFFWKDRAYFKALIFIILLPAIFLYGSIRMKDNEFIDTKLIGVVQPNVLQNDKINNPDEYEILIGNITFQADKFKNSALLIDQDKKIRDIYHKVHLVPFGEYMPFHDILSKLPFMKIITGDIGFDSGKEINSIYTKVGNARIAICYEIIFPEEINPNNEKLDLIINITNDAWFGNSSGPFQHFNSSRFRAIEQGIPVFRSANTGISAIIDPYGRIIDKIGLGKKGSIFSPLPKKTLETYYSKVGDFLFFGVLILTLLIMIFLKKKKKYG